MNTIGVDRKGNEFEVIRPTVLGCGKCNKMFDVKVAVDYNMFENHVVTCKLEKDKK